MIEKQEYKSWHGFVYLYSNQNEILYPGKYKYLNLQSRDLKISYGQSN